MRFVNKTFGVNGWKKKKTALWFIFFFKALFKLNSPWNERNCFELKVRDKLTGSALQKVCEEQKVQTWISSTEHTKLTEPEEMKSFSFELHDGEESLLALQTTSLWKNGSFTLMDK